MAQNNHSLFTPDSAGAQVQLGGSPAPHGVAWGCGRLGYLTGQERPAWLTHRLGPSGGMARTPDSAGTLRELSIFLPLNSPKASPSVLGKFSRVPGLLM